MDEPSVIDELTDRFARSIKTGDESVIPQDIVSSCYLAVCFLWLVTSTSLRLICQAVKYGGRAEFEVMKQIYEKPKTTAAQIAAMSV